MKHARATRISRDVAACTIRELRRCGYLPSAAVTIAALVGSISASAQNIRWNNANCGPWATAANWTPQNVPDNCGEVAVFDTPLTCAPWIDSNVSVGGLQIVDPGASLTINANRSLSICSNNYLNNGTILVNPANAGFSETNLFAGASLTLNGTGDLRLLGSNDYSRLAGAASAIVTNGPGHRISGIGSVVARVRNLGIIDANTFGYELWLRSPEIENSHIIQATSGGKLRLQNGLIRGGVIQSNTDGIVSAGDGGARLRNVTFAEGSAIYIWDNRSLFVNAGTLTNDANIVVDPNFNDAVLGIEGNCEIRRTNGAIDRAVGIDLVDQDSIVRMSASASLRNTAGHRIRGVGVIDSFNGSFTNEAFIEPGRPLGKLRVSGGYTQTASGTLAIQLGGRSTGQFDVLEVVNGGAAVAGTLELRLANNFVPTLNDRFVVLTATNGVQGRFNRVDANIPGFGVALTYNATNVEVRITNCSLSSDMNADGRVDIEDLAILLSNFGCSSNCTREHGDLDGDGVIGVQDMAIVLSDFGDVCP